MITNKSNIVLIGMPGAGKSTVGIMLAKELCLDYVDTDVLIQIREGVALQNIIDQLGYMELRRVEENVISSINLCNHVVATGGSAVYSAKAMEHLGKEGLIIFLEVSFNEILRRISNFKTRGIARRPDQSFEDLFEERLQLYKKYAHKTIFSDGKTQDMVVKEILTVL